MADADPKSAAAASALSSPQEPIVRLPAASAVTAALVAGLIAMACAAWLSGRLTAPTSGTPIPDLGAVIAAVPTPDAVRSSILGSSVALAVSIPLFLVLLPWRARPAGTWAVIWLAGITGRLLLTPVVALAVYSATPVRPDTFLLSLAGTYLVCLAAEVAVSARGVARSIAAAEATK